MHASSFWLAYVAACTDARAHPCRHTQTPQTITGCAEPTGGGGKGSTRVGGRRPTSALCAPRASACVLFALTLCLRYVHLRWYAGGRRPTPSRKDKTSTRVAGAPHWRGAYARSQKPCKPFQDRKPTYRQNRAAAEVGRRLLAACPVPSEVRSRADPGRLPLIPAHSSMSVHRDACMNVKTHERHICAATTHSQPASTGRSQPAPTCITKSAGWWLGGLEPSRSASRGHPDSRQWFPASCRGTITRLVPASHCKHCVCARARVQTDRKQTPPDHKQQRPERRSVSYSTRRLPPPPAPLPASP